MKKLIKIYKMLYRLLRLKKEQRAEIERIVSSQFRATIFDLNKAFFEVQFRLKEYENVMVRFGIDNPLKLFKALECCPGLICSSTRCDHLFLKEMPEAQYRDTAIQPKEPTWPTGNH